MDCYYVRVGKTRLLTVGAEGVWFFYCTGKGKMVIEKVINNNIVTALDNGGNEVILMGKGIGFRAKSGQVIKENLVEKRYIMDSHADVNQFGQLLNSIPLEHLDISMDIISYARQVLNNRLSSSIYMSLTDHINFALERYHTGVVFENHLLNEVRSFYPREYLIGKYAISLIEERMDVLLPVDEAGAIALHFVNAEYNMSMGDTMHIPTLIREMLQIVEREVGAGFEEHEMEQVELITNLKYLAYHIIKKDDIKGQASELLEVMSSLYPKEYLISQEIVSFVKENYEYDISDDAVASLILYIKRIM